MKGPTLDILIPTKDHPDFLVATLTSLAMQGGNLEWVDKIFVRDEGDTPVTNHVAASVVMNLLSSKYEVIYTRDWSSGGSVSHARQKMLEMSSASYVMTLDDDIVFDHSQALANLIFHMRGVMDSPYFGGWVVDIDNNQSWPDYSREVKKKRRGPGFYRYPCDMGPWRSLDGPSDNCCIWVREWLIEVGGWSDWKTTMPRRGHSLLVKRRLAKLHGEGLFVPGCGAWHLDSNHNKVDKRFQFDRLADFISQHGDKK